MTFELTEDHLVEMFRLANFEVPLNELVLFGLRGTSPVGSQGVMASSHKLVDKGVDFVHQRCTIGQWMPGAGFAVHAGSTVPNITGVEKGVPRNGQGVNMLSPCYLTDLPGSSDHRYAKGDHGITSSLGPHRAFRNANKLPVWRTGDDTDYEGDDRLVYEQAFDNLHCSRHMDHTTPGYSSLGCQVVAGSAGGPTSRPGGEKGAWKSFIEAAYALTQQRFRYALFNDGEALRTAELGASARLPTVRFGSTGDLARHMQQGLIDAGFDIGTAGADGVVGFQTLLAVRDVQLRAFGPTGVDLVFGALTAAEIGIAWPGPGENGVDLEIAETTGRGSIDLLLETPGETADTAIEAFNVVPVREARANGTSRWVFQDPDDGIRRYLGGEAKLQGFAGLGRLRGFDAENAPLYSHKDWVGDYGAWAALIEPTGEGESHNSFTCLNSYDRAAFTFGFYQLAAHTPKDNLILLFRRLLATAEAARYFPDLCLKNGLVHRFVPGGTTSLEGPQPRQDGDARQGEQGAFMEYVNSDMHGVDEAECRTAARLIHWACHSQEHRAIQVDVAVDLAKKKVARIAQRVRDNGTVLDQRPMAEVAMALDILHNGRGGGQTFPLIAAALKDSDPMSALSQIGRTSVFADRIDRVRKRAKAVLGSRSFKNLRYDESTNSFA